MMRKNMNSRSLVLGLLLSLVVSLLLPGGVAVGAIEKPNIVFIMIDDMGWKDVSFMGSKFYETPNIDQLSQQGMKFTNAYANAANCAPTRACLLSGQYTPRHGVYTVGSSERGKSALRKLIPTKNTTELRGDIITLGESMKKAGYATAHMGKWHLGDGDLGPTGQGFDLNIGGNHAGHPRTYFSPYRNKNLKDGPKGENLTDRLTDEAIKFITSNKNQPFFLYLPYYAVHTPIQPKKELVAKYENKPKAIWQGNPKYAAMVETVDTNVGRLMKTLDDLNLADNTIVVFFSDNGGHGGVTNMKPLRGSKGMIYEGGIREPLIVRWPGKIKAGTTCEVPVIGVDFYPTFLSIVGAEKPTGQPLDGANITPLLTGKGKFDPQRPIFWHSPVYLQAYRGLKVGPWRITPCSAVRQGDWKLIEFFEDNRVELYNLREDIGEIHDLSKKNPTKAAALLKILKNWQKQTGAPIPTQLNPKFDAKLRQVADNKAVSPQAQ